MKNYIITITFLLNIFKPLYSQESKKYLDYQAIKKMAGCYNIEFNFAETFNYSDDSSYVKSPNKIAYATELVKVIKDTPSEISLQHILVMGSGKNQFIIKHWRQDWLYENRNFYMYDFENKWIYKNYEPENIVGQWTQKVFQVDDCPRYEGTGHWIHINGKSYWESETTAPLPRREYTKRSDYNQLYRRSRHEITSYGWLHEQDNDKIIRNINGIDSLLAKEKGFNTYTRISDETCEGGEIWWNENSKKWDLIREVWNEFFESKLDLSLNLSINNIKMYEMLFELGNDVKKSKIKKKLKPYIKTNI
tara:strand:- start:59 stop:976 length:918 start_codon:yes stop_codon:yes gene_type:complete